MRLSSTSGFFRYDIQCAAAVLEVASLLIIRVVFICFGFVAMIG